MAWVGTVTSHTSCHPCKVSGGYCSARTLREWGRCDPRLQRVCSLRRQLTNKSAINVTGQVWESTEEGVSWQRTLEVTPYVI